MRQSPLGYEIEGVEYDCLLEFWGVPVRDETADLAAIQTVAFSTLNRVFSPTALLNLHPEKREIVELRFRGADLPRGSQQMPVAKPGQVMRPYLREVDRAGIPVEQGINPVSWTYLALILLMKSPRRRMQTRRQRMPLSPRFIVTPGPPSVHVGEGESSRSRLPLRVAGRSPNYGCTPGMGLITRW